MGIKLYENKPIAVLKCDKDKVFKASASSIARNLGLIGTSVSIGIYDLMHADVDSKTAEALANARDIDDEDEVEKLIKNEVVETTIDHRGAQKHIMRTTGRLINTNPDVTNQPNSIDLSNDPNDLVVRVVYERTKSDPSQS